MKKILTLLTITFIISNCASTPIGKSQARPVEARNQYKHSEKNYSSSITVVRDRGFGGSACDTNITINNELCGKISQGEYIELFLPAGEYILGAEPRGLCAGVLLEKEVLLQENEEKRYRYGNGSNGDNHLMRTGLK